MASHAKPLPIAEVAVSAPAAVERMPLDVLRTAVESASSAERRAHANALLHLARAYEPGQRLTPRRRLLDEADHVGDEHIQRAVAAERAIDAARASDLNRAEVLARRALAGAGPTDEVAHARGIEALARVLAWRGDEVSARQASAHFDDATDRYAALGTTEWQGYCIFWRAQALNFQRGDLDGARDGFAESLRLLAPDSPRRGIVLTFVADLLATRGEWAEAHAALEEAMSLGVRHGDKATPAYATWQQARIASMRGDPIATARYLAESERHAAEWFDVTSGSTFLADAAELLDRVGEYDLADEYLRRARTFAPDDEYVLQANAAMMARRGDPGRAIAALHALPRAPWLEPRLAWRRTLLLAYACLRAGRAEAGEIAARSFSEAEAIGDARIAVIGEPELTSALAPLAAACGSPFARRLIAPTDGLVVRLLGEVSFARAGVPVAMPSGIAGSLARLVAASPGGVAIDVVLDLFWPDVAPGVASRRLRDTIARVRASAGDVVIRDGSQLVAGAEWVDATAFRHAADQALSARSRDRGTRAVAALALWTGELLPSDPYEQWAMLLRDQLRRRRLDLLDVVAAEAAAAGSYEEARLALEQAIEADPYDEARYVSLADHLIALGRRTQAQRILARGMSAVGDNDVAPPPRMTGLHAQRTNHARRSGQRAGGAGPTGPR